MQQQWEEQMNTQTVYVKQLSLAQRGSDDSTMKEEPSLHAAPATAEEQTLQLLFHM